MSDNLDTLRKTAEAATPGPWARDGVGVLGARESWDLGKGPARIMQAMMPWHRERMEANAEFIATFDPPTVLALLSRLEQAERNFEEADSAKIEAEGREGQALERAEQAEQAVQRVRRLHKKLPFRVGTRNTGIPEFVCEACHGEAWGAVEYPCPTIRALDGDTSADV